MTKEEQDIEKERNERSAISPLTDMLGLSQDSFAKQEVPDFKFNYNGKTIGLEVTFCLPSSIDSNDKCNNKRVQSYIDLLTETTKKRLIAKGYHGFSLSLSISSNVFCDEKLRKDAFVEDAYEEIERHLRNDQYVRKIESGEADFDFYKKYLEMSMNGEFSYRYVEQADYVDISSVGGEYVTDLQVIFCRPIQQCHVDACITKKEEKLIQYRQISKNKDVDEFWLLINVPTVEYCYIDGYTVEREISSGFSRIYLTKWKDIKLIKGACATSTT